MGTDADAQKKFVELAEQLKLTMPPMIPRVRLEEYGWPYTAGYMANLDSDKQETSPSHIYIGSRVVYLRDGDNGLIDWLINRASERNPCKSIERKPGGRRKSTSDEGR